ncbi:hypothetical protein ACTXT7_016531, partial [Hymenolepis weldensis]
MSKRVHRFPPFSTTASFHIKTLSLPRISSTPLLSLTLLKPHRGLFNRFWSSQHL